VVGSIDLLCILVCTAREEPLHSTHTKTYYVEPTRAHMDKYLIGQYEGDEMHEHASSSRLRDTSAPSHSERPSIAVPGTCPNFTSSCQRSAEWCCNPSIMRTPRAKSSRAMTGDECEGLISTNFGTLVRPWLCACGQPAGVAGGR
jgi:hypothetical protein